MFYKFSRFMSIKYAVAGCKCVCVCIVNYSFTYKNEFINLGNSMFLLSDARNNTVATFTMKLIICVCARAIFRLLYFRIAHENAAFSYLNRLSAHSIKCLTVLPSPNVIKSTCTYEFCLIKINFMVWLMLILDGIFLEE